MAPYPLPRDDYNQPDLCSGTYLTTLLQSGQSLILQFLTKFIILITQMRPSSQKRKDRDIFGITKLLSSDIHIQVSLILFSGIT